MAAAAYESPTLLSAAKRLGGGSWETIRRVKMMAKKAGPSRRTCGGPADRLRGTTLEEALECVRKLGCRADCLNQTGEAKKRIREGTTVDRVHPNNSQSPHRSRTVCQECVEIKNNPSESIRINTSIKTYSVHSIATTNNQSHLVIEHEHDSKSFSQLYLTIEDANGLSTQLYLIIKYKNGSISHLDLTIEDTNESSTQLGVTVEHASGLPSQSGLAIEDGSELSTGILKFRDLSHVVAMEEIIAEILFVARDLFLSSLAETSKGDAESPSMRPGFDLHPDILVLRTSCLMLRLGSACMMATIELVEQNESI
jgi:hypothetical protein